MSSIRLVARVSRMSVFTASLRPALVRPCVLRTTSAFLPKSHQISALYSRSVWNTALTSRSLSTTPFASQGGPEGPITSELISTMRNKISTALETDMGKDNACILILCKRVCLPQTARLSAQLKCRTCKEMAGMWR